MDIMKFEICRVSVDLEYICILLESIPSSSVFFGRKRGQFLVRQHAGTPALARLFILCYSVSVGKQNRQIFWKAGFSRRWRK